MTPKFEIGDKVHVEYTIKRIGHDGTCQVLQLERPYRNLDGTVSPAIPSQKTIVVPNNPDIVKHIPKPVMVEAGDKFKFDGGSTTYKILAVFEDTCWWVKDGTNGLCKWSIFASPMYQKVVE